jgi:hypothetical protein
VSADGVAADAGAAGPARGRNRLLARWAVAGLLVPGVLGGLSWLCFEARLGAVFDVLADLAMFLAPLSPLLLKAFSARVVVGVQPYLLAAAVGAANAAIYALLGTLQWRLRAQPRVNQWLWLTVVTGVGFSVTLFAALIWAFAGR